MKLYLGVTDNPWYDYLSVIHPEDVNFWQPGGKTIFKVLQQGEPFLFKLKSPRNAIGGVGFFASHTFLPLSMAWEIFNTRNGVPDIETFNRTILQYRSDNHNPNPTIGCIVLTDPIFFRPDDWIDVPSTWNRNIVQGKSFSTADSVGSDLWQKVYALLQTYLAGRADENLKDQFIISEPSSPMYGMSIMRKVRLGQGPFRELVTDAYSRRCSVSGEKTLPVLEAAHVKPYASSGPHAISNGILLRADLHKLYDTGYITITSDFKIEVSARIKEEYQNGKEYYQFHGKDLLILPGNLMERPAQQFIDWHNSNVYRG